MHPTSTDATARAPQTRRELREREAAQLANREAAQVANREAAQVVSHEAAQLANREAAPLANREAAHPHAGVTPPARAEFPRRADVAQARSRSGARRGRVPNSAARQLKAATHGRPSQKRSFKDRAAGKLFSALAMLFAGALMIGTSVPANAFISPSTSLAGEGALETATQSATATQAKLPTQSVVVSAGAADPASVRDGFTVISYAEQLRLKYGNRSYAFTATTGAVRWPFPYPVPITDGWGERVAPCYGCSTFHQALDFTPGAGAPIYAIADGVVSKKEVTDSGLGNFVTIDHVINGVNVGSTYAHMQWGTSPLNIGDVVKVGDFVGLVGETGAATGPHLHFELTIEGTKVDPFAWLTENAVN